MADKKKMSVAEMLAAARKSDGGQSDAPEPEQPVAETEAAAPEASEAAAPSAPAAQPKPVPKLGSADRPSVAEMMAMARKGDAEGGKAAAKPAAEKPKPAAKKQGAAKAAPAKAAPAEPRDTASILASARKSSKAGPMNKAEAAAKAKADPAAKPAKRKIVVPPMPEKPAYAQASPYASPKTEEAADESRRNFMSLGFWSLGAATLFWTLASVKFMFPNVLREAPSKFKVGLPDAFPPGQVSTKYKAQFAVWIANSQFNGQQQIYALKSVCTHLGCTPNWLEAEQKYKCPCHGSGFYKDGINFEGPAPRPLERYAIAISDDGQIEIDRSQTFQEEMGQWEDPSCFIPV